MDDLTIYIPSCGRHDKLYSLRQMPQSLKDKTILVVAEDEYKLYEPFAKEGVTIQVCDNGMTFTQKIKKIFSECPTRYCCRMDDDLTFFKRKEDMHLVKATEQDMELLFERMCNILHRYALAGISSRGGNSFVKEPFLVNTRMHRCWFIDLQIFRKLNIDISPFPEFLMDDFHTILSFLEKGYENIVYYDYACDDRGSNSAGGLSSFRTNEVQEKSALWLAEHHSSVQLKVKTSKTGWKGMKEDSQGNTERVDVNVQWKKAFMSNRKTGRTFSDFIKKRNV